MMHPPRGTCVRGCKLYGFCHCKCGRPTTIAAVSRRLAGYVKGEPVQYLKGHYPRRPAEAWVFRKTAEGPHIPAGPFREFLIRRVAQTEITGMNTGTRVMGGARELSRLAAERWGGDPKHHERQIVRITSGASPKVRLGTADEWITLFGEHPAMVYGPEWFDFGLPELVTSRPDG